MHICFMKERIQHGLATLVCLLGLVASGEPVRLAVVPVAPGINPTAEILTAALTGDGQVALVERSEIDRIMQEQALSAQNRNAVGLGQVGIGLAKPGGGGTARQILAGIRDLLPAGSNQS
jgi:hypothetical protein